MQMRWEYIWCIAYIDVTKIKSLEHDLSKRREYSEIEAYIPTVRVLKKQFKGEEKFNEIPFLFNYGFFKIPMAWAINQDLMIQIRENIGCISGWMPDRAKSKKYIPKNHTNLIIDQSHVLVATATESELHQVIISSAKMDIYSAEDIDKLTTGLVITLMGYPFEGMEARIKEVNKKKRQLIVVLLMDHDLDQEIKISFDNAIYSIYHKAGYDENKSTEVLLEDFKIGTYKVRNYAGED